MQAEIHNDHIDRDVLEVTLTGQMILENPLLNKGSIFPEDERRELRLLGLVLATWHIRSENRHFEHD